MTLPNPCRRLGGKVDFIFHLASRASPGNYQEYPVETALANSVGTEQMARLIAAHGVSTENR